MLTRVIRELQQYASKRGTSEFGVDVDYFIIDKEVIWDRREQKSSLSYVYGIIGKTSSETSAIKEGGAIVFPGGAGIVKEVEETAEGLLSNYGQLKHKIKIKGHEIEITLFGSPEEIQKEIGELVQASELNRIIYQ